MISAPWLQMEREDRIRQVAWIELGIELPDDPSLSVAELLRLIKDVGFREGWEEQR